MNHDLRVFPASLEVEEFRALISDPVPRYRNVNTYIDSVLNNGAETVLKDQHLVIHFPQYRGYLRENNCCVIDASDWDFRLLGKGIFRNRNNQTFF